MSLRPKKLNQVSSLNTLNTLNHVLEIGMNASSPANAINIAGLRVSTDSNKWTGLTTPQIVRLMLKPEDEEAFNRNGYTGTVFKSYVTGFSDYRFFIDDLQVFKVDNITTAYYVLARPASDTKTYTRA